MSSKQRLAVGSSVDTEATLASPEPTPVTRPLETGATPVNVGNAPVSVGPMPPPPAPPCPKQEQAEVNEAAAVNSARKLGSAMPVGEAKKDEQNGVACALNRRSARSSLSSKQVVAVVVEIGSTGRDGADVTAPSAPLEVGAERKALRGMSPRFRLAQLVMSVRTLKPILTQA